MIGYGMMYAVAAGIPVALAAVILSSVLRRYGRPERWIWLTATALALGTPALMLLTSRGSDPISTVAVSTLGVTGLPEFVVVPVREPVYDLSVLLLVLWIGASATMAIRWIVAAHRLSRASRVWRAETIDGLPVWVTNDVGPAVAGTFRPRVLAPTWLDSLPGDQRSLVLMHEREHIRAHDPILIACVRVSRILTPWNPVVWFISARLVRAVELDCDRRVLKRSADVAAYGNTLLAVSQRRPAVLVTSAAFAESEAPLRHRILAMTTPPRTVSMIALTAAMALAVLLLAGACEIPVPTAVADGPDTPTVDQSPTTTTFDVPPGPPVAVAEPTRLPEPDPVPPVTTRQGSEPGFTPMTIRPVLTNATEMRDVLGNEYPALLRDAGIGGAPVLWIHIATDGTVDDTRVFQTSGQPTLDEAAGRVARAMRFKPAQNGDETVDAWVQIPIRFAAGN